MGEAHGHDVSLRWDARDSQCFEVELWDRNRRDQEPQQPLESPRPNEALLWSTYANDPLENSFRQQLIAALREHLKARLPEYMIPSAWMILKQLPLTLSGKLDRRALRAPQNRGEEHGEYVEPQTELERALADIWAQLLRVDRVGFQDNFFGIRNPFFRRCRISIPSGKWRKFSRP